MPDTPPKPASDHPDAVIVPRELIQSATDFFASEVHKTVRENTVLGDQKAALMFTAMAAGLAYLHEKGATWRWVTVPVNAVSAVPAAEPARGEVLS